MKLIGHIIKKDLQRLSVPLTLWLLLRVAKLWFFSFAAGVGGESHSHVLLEMQNALGTTLTLATEPLIVFFLVGMLVFEDSIVEKDAFWITRPISGRMLLTAKVVGAALMFVLLPVLIDLPWWLACGFGFVDIAGSVIVTGAAYSLVVLCALAIASATDGFPRFTLWTIVAMITFTGLHLLVIAGVFGQSQLVLEGQIFTENNAGFWRYADYAFETFRGVVGNLGIYCLGLVTVSTAILYRQYLKQSFWWAAVISFSGTIVFLVACFAVTQILPEHSFQRMQTWLHQKYEAPQTQQTVRVKMGGDAYFQIKKGARPMIVPLIVDGLRNDQVVWPQLTKATWSMGGAAVWTCSFAQGSRSSISYAQGVGPSASVESLAQYLLDHSKADSKPVVASYTFSFAFSDVLAKRMVHEPAVFHCSGSLGISRGTISSELPLAPHSERIPFGSFSIGEIRRDGDKVSFVIAERRSTLGQLLSGDHGYYSYVLLQRSTGQIMSFGQKDGWFWSSWDSQLNLVSIECKECSFSLPKEVTDLNDFTVVVINFRSEANLSSEWTLDADPFPFGGIVSAQK